MIDKWWVAWWLFVVGFSMGVLFRSGLCQKSTRGQSTDNAFRIYKHQQGDYWIAERNGCGWAFHTKKMREHSPP